MADLNACVLIGRLTGNPVLQQRGEDMLVAGFSLAINKLGKVKGGVSYVPVEAWGRKAELVRDYCRKGKEVVLQGHLDNRSWPGDTAKGSRLVLVAEFIQFTRSRGEEREDPIKGLEMECEGNE